MTSFIHSFREQRDLVSVSIGRACNADNHISLHLPTELKMFVNILKHISECPSCDNTVSSAFFTLLLECSHFKI